MQQRRTTARAGAASRRPWAGAFWSEIVIVALGVLIALAANEAVQNWNWRNKVQDAEMRLSDDMQETFIVAAEQYTTAPCVQAQLVALTRNLMQDEKPVVPTPIYAEKNMRFVVRLPNRTNRFSVWDSLIADGTATRFAQQRQNTYGLISESINRWRVNNEEANRLGWRLMALGYPMTLSDDGRRDFLVDIAEMSSRIALGELQSKQRMANITEFGSAPAAEQVQGYINDSGTVQFCKAHSLPLADWRDALKQ